MQTQMVEVHNLSKDYRRDSGDLVKAVKSVSFSIPKGTIFSLLGPNGSGKTTTISMISGLLTPTSGDATIGGYSITKHPLDAKRLLGVVPQEIALYPQLSARQNLEFFGKMYGLRGDSLKKRVDEVLVFIDLTDRQKDKIETFSGGMKRRVNIGVGMLHQPQLMYMDEPTVGIDPQNRRRILDTVVKMRDDLGMTVLYTSHLMEEVQEISNYVAIIDQGEFIAQGSVGDLIEQVGEQDRLLLQVGTQLVSEATLEAIRTGVENVTSVTFERHEHEAGLGMIGVIEVVAPRGRRALPQVIMMVNEHGLEINSVEVREPDLEAVFLRLTGRALRD
jgi:ABC-2 type transport system ATP-binding protein